MKSLMYSDEMVKAELAGRKWQTRRVVNPQPRWQEEAHLLPLAWMWAANGAGNPNGKYAGCHFDEAYMKSELLKFCPWKVGERIYIKEAYGYLGDQVVYRGEKGNVKWKSKMFMKEEESRLKKLLIGIRCERVQDISYEDAIAEGIEPIGEGWKNYLDFRSAFEFPLFSFSSLWGFINSEPKLRKTNPYGVKEACYVSYPWVDIRRVEKFKGLTHYIIGNPFVYVLEFDR